MDELGADGRYIVISADCHGGGDVHDYRPYLPSKHLDAFDAWAAAFDNPYPDLQGPNGGRNWDSDRRLKELETDGVVAEVIFPNTIPPFFPGASLVYQPPGATEGDLELRWVGLKAHNRWLADFCQEAPGRRAGIAQILLHDVDAAVDEVRWAKDAGLTGGVLLGGAPPGSGLPPLYAPDYEPLWSVCEELDMPVNHHSGSAAPDYGEYPEAKVMFLLEVTWWAHRTLWHLIFGGVMERHPELQVAFTEQGTAWLPEQLRTLDYYQARMSAPTGSPGSRPTRSSRWWAPTQPSCTASISTFSRRSRRGWVRRSRRWLARSMSTQSCRTTPCAARSSRPPRPSAPWVRKGTADHDEETQ